MRKRRLKRSLFAQLKLFTCGILLVLCVGFFATEQYLRRTLRGAMLDSNEKLMIQIEGRIEEFYSTMKSIATFVVYSPTVTEYYGRDARGRLLLQEEVLVVFSNALLMEPDIVGIFLYDMSLNKIAGMGEEPKRENGGLVLRQKMEFGNVEETKLHGDSCYSIYFPVYDLNNREYGTQIGMCVFLMRTDSFRGFLEDSQITEHAQVYLADGNHQALESADGAVWPPEDWGAQSDGKYIVTEKSLLTGQWKVVSRIPEGELRQEAFSSMKGTAVAYLGAVMMVSAMLLFCYWKMINRIQKIDRFVHSVVQEPGLRLDDRGKDELGVVAHSLNEMLDERERMNAEILKSQQKMYEIELEKRQTQILAYQNQIHPHFLYNTFDCIRSMALYYEVEDIAELTLALSKMFRFAVKADNVITVSEEIEHIREYAKIIAYRFMGKIKINIEADGETLGRKVAKFILQPLVENAVFHGLEKKMEGGEVVVTAARKDGSHMVFEVSDNGCGMEEKKRAWLMETLESGLSHKGIGISNIYHRLKLFYGDDAFLEIESAPNTGTKVTITVSDDIKEM